jgi:hypothetical protein
MDIPLEKLAYAFDEKPVVVGGKAMEYYGLRKSGDDIDLVASQGDIANLIKLYPSRLKDLSGDLGVCPFEFEIWRTINYFDYSHYRENSVEQDQYRIVSLEKLLVMKAMAIEKEKYFRDIKLITTHITTSQALHSREIGLKNKQLLERVEGIAYLEITDKSA